MIGEAAAVGGIGGLGLGGGTLGIIVGLGLLLRRWSRDKLEIAKDRAEGDLIGHLIKQRDDARQERVAIEDEIEKLAQESDDAIKKIRELTASNQQLQAQVAMLTNLVNRLVTALDESKDQLRAIRDEVISPSEPEGTRG